VAINFDVLAALSKAMAVKLEILLESLGRIELLKPSLKLSD
jgi:hypothetical protein